MSEEWETIEIVEGNVISDPDTQPLTVGLTPQPQQLHSEHLSNANHLAEVQDIHTRLLVNAGELPESHLAEIHPQRQLEWMVAELGGSVGDRSISIPLRGTSLNRVEVCKGELHGHPAMKLHLLDLDLEKTIPLPAEVGELTAVWDSGDLHITW